MSTRHSLRILPFLLVTIAALLATTEPAGADRAEEAVRIASQKITDSDPMVRAKAVDDLARANNRSGTLYILKAMQAENDGPAGFNMAESIMKLTSEEALGEIEKTITRWNRPENLFGAYWTLLGVSQQRNDRADELIRNVADKTGDRDIYLRAALIEALAEADRDDMGELLLPMLEDYDPKWDEQQPILVTTLVHAAPSLTGSADKEMRGKIVLALADVLDKTESKRIEWFTCQALSEITGEDTYTDPEFWRWWVELGGERAEKSDGVTTAGNDVPKFFNTGAVGKRVVFVIDISGSMKGAVEMPPETKKPEEEERKGPVTGKGGRDNEEDEEEEIPPPDYSGVKTKLDLAKVELIHTLKYLPEDYFFNIVIYDTPHRMIDQSNDEFVQATERNKNNFIKKVEGLTPAELTNIYGALRRGFCVNMKRTINPNDVGKRNTNNPAWDPDCLMTGATTMFFLTDGSPTVTDDTIDKVKGGEMAQGEARFCQTNNILYEVKRLNTFRKCVINTVGIGPHNGQLLGALARLTGGEYADRRGVTGG